MTKYTNLVKLVNITRIAATDGYIVSMRLFYRTANGNTTDADAASGETPLEHAVRTQAGLHAEHIRKLQPTQRKIEWLTDRIGRPWFAYALVVFIGLWIGVDMLLVPRHRFDTAAFPMLQLVLSVFSLLMAAFILITENREGNNADQRARVTLQIAMINEQKTSKIIQLLEQLRKDDPSLPKRTDDEAKQMAEATELRSAIEQMEDAEHRLSNEQ